MRKPKEQKRWPESIMLLTGVHNTKGVLRCWGISDSNGLTAALPDAVFGMTASDFENYFSVNMATEEGDLLVVANDAYRTLTNLGLWAMVKSGELRLAGTDYRGNGVPLCIVEDPPTIVRVRVPQRRGEIVFCDSANWGWSMPLENGDASPAADVPLTANREHCLARVFWRLTNLSRFVADYERLLANAYLGESWRMTAGSQASFGFRRYYMPCPIEVPDGSPDEALIEKALYGGRCECRILGEVHGPVWQLDARQLYSAAAAQCEVPVSLIGEADLLNEKKWWNGHMMDCVADVTLSTRLPIFPYRAYPEQRREKSAITIWPVGRFRTVLAGPELSLAETCGFIEDVHSSYAYKCEPVLREWANVMFAYRERATDSMTAVVKRIALGLYGKFAQRQREWVVDPEDMPPADVEVGDWYTMAADGKLVRHRVLDGKCMTERCEGFVPQSSPPIAAWITSYARLMLWDFICIAKEVYYYDTDSVWVGRAGYDNLKAAGRIGNGLGDLKVAGEYERVTFRGIKDYQCEALRTKAGVPHNADKVGEHTWQWEETTAWASHMANNEMPDGTTRRRTLRARQQYRHGVVQADGTIVPHRLSDERCTVPSPETQSAEPENNSGRTP